MKKSILTSTLILGATLGLATVTFAQSGQMDPRRANQGVHAPKSNNAPSTPDTERGGPGPRVQGGSGAGAGGER